MDINMKKYTDEDLWDLTYKQLEKIIVDDLQGEIPKDQFKNTHKRLRESVLHFQRLREPQFNVLKQMRGLPKVMIISAGYLGKSTLQQSMLARDHVHVVEMDFEEAEKRMATLMTTYPKLAEFTKCTKEVIVRMQDKGMTIKPLKRLPRKKKKLLKCLRKQHNHEKTLKFAERYGSIGTQTGRFQTQVPNISNTPKELPQ